MWSVLSNQCNQTIKPNNGKRKKERARRVHAPLPWVSISLRWYSTYLPSLSPPICEKKGTKTSRIWEYLVHHCFIWEKHILLRKRSSWREHGPHLTYINFDGLNCIRIMSVCLRVTRVSKKGMRGLVASLAIHRGCRGHWLGHRGSLD